MNRPYYWYNRFWRREDISETNNSNINNMWNHIDSKYISFAISLEAQSADWNEKLNDKLQKKKKKKRQIPAMFDRAVSHLRTWH